METIDIYNRDFTIDDIDEILHGRLPGKYKIVIHKGKTIYECFVKYNGHSWIDLYQQKH